MSDAPGAAGAAGTGGSASSRPVASTSPPAPTAPRSAHRPARPAAPADPEIAELLKQAEDAYRKKLKPLLQLGPAGAVLQVQPGNLRARFLAGDALLRDGETENGCKYLAMAKALPVARTRARAAGCPDD